MKGEAPIDTLKRLFTSGNATGTTDQSAYACRKCQAQFDRQHTVCPECGGRSVEQADWEDPVR